MSYQIIEKIIALLSGTDRNILEDMKQKMEVCAKNYQFEAAGKWRDCINAVQSLIHKEQVIQFTAKNKTIIVSEFLNNDTVKLFLIQRNKIQFCKKYAVHNVDFNRLKNEIKNHLCSDSFNTITQKTSRDEIDEAQIIYHYLTSNNNRFFVIPNNWIDEKLSQLLEYK